MFDCLQDLFARKPSGSLGVHPPVLVVPNAMDAEICERLIEVWHRPVRLWEEDGKATAGFEKEPGDFKVWSPRYRNVVQYVVRDPVLSQEIDDVIGRGHVENRHQICAAILAFAEVEIDPTRMTEIGDRGWGRRNP